MHTPSPVEIALALSTKSLHVELHGRKRVTCDDNY